jgi:probable F420-dependent oxidoreductase
MTDRLSLDASLTVDAGLLEAPALARAAEQIGFDGLWSSEVNHDPFIPLALAATQTARVNLGTSIALSFTRSPMTLAYTCWDLAAMSKGRFILGLGTQVKAHNERRFGVPWDAPLPKLREVINAMRAIWHSWRTGERLNFRGDFYQLTLMTPFFTPQPHQYDIPVMIAGVNTGLCRLAGELCDGFHVHPLHSIKYLDEVVRRGIAEGTTSAGRNIDDVPLVASVFVISGDNDREAGYMREMVRQQISFYASTPSYRVIFETHGWADAAEKLSHLAARKQWAEMPGLITDEMLDAFAISGPPEKIGELALERYRGRVSRIAFYLPFLPGTHERLWKSAIGAFTQQ